MAYLTLVLCWLHVLASLSHACLLPFPESIIEDDATAEIAKPTGKLHHTASRPYSSIDRTTPVMTLVTPNITKDHKVIILIRIPNSNPPPRRRKEHKQGLTVKHVNQYHCSTSQHKIIRNPNPGCGALDPNVRLRYFERQRKKQLHLTPLPASAHSWTNYWLLYKLPLSRCR